MRDSRFLAKYTSIRLCSSSWRWSRSWSILFDLSCITLVTVKVLPRSTPSTTGDREVIATRLFRKYNFLVALSVALSVINKAMKAQFFANLAKPRISPEEKLCFMRGYCTFLSHYCNARNWYTDVAVAWGYLAVNFDHDVWPWPSYLWQTSLNGAGRTPYAPLL